MNPFDTQRAVPEREQQAPAAVRMKVKTVKAAGQGIYECVLWDGANEGADTYLVYAVFPFMRADPNTMAWEVYAVAPLGGTQVVFEGKPVQLLGLPFIPRASAGGQYLFQYLEADQGVASWGPGPRCMQELPVT